MYFDSKFTLSGRGVASSWWESLPVRLDSRGRSLSSCSPTTWVSAAGLSGVVGRQTPRRRCCPLTAASADGHHLEDDTILIINILYYKRRLLWIWSGLILVPSLRKFANFS